MAERPARVRAALLGVDRLEHVLEKREGVVTNHEVLSLLRRQAAARDDEEKRQKLPGARRTAPAVTQWRSQQEVRAITRQVIEYLEQGCAADQSRESIAEFMRAMEPFGLTQAEVLNLVNTRPRSLVEVHLIVEECEERLTQQQRTELLRRCALLDSSGGGDGGG